MSSLVPFWYIVITILWTGFFILEGFDFGVGMLHDFVGTDDASRRAAINTIGPLWDGNEVWLIVAGASTLPAVSRTSQVRRQRAASRLPRYSKATPRTIRAASSRTSARL